MDPAEMQLKKKADEYVQEIRKNKNNKLIQEHRDNLDRTQEDSEMAKLGDEMSQLRPINYDDDRQDCVWVTAAKLLGVDLMVISFGLKAFRSKLKDRGGAGLDTLKEISAHFKQKLEFQVLSSGSLEMIQTRAKALAAQLNTNKAGLLYSRKQSSIGHCIVYEQVGTSEEWKFVDYQAKDAENYGRMIAEAAFYDGSWCFPVMVFAFSRADPKDVMSG